MITDAQIKERSPEEIIRWARAHAKLMDCGKIIIPKGLAKCLRAINAWDDESMYEQRDLPIGRGAIFRRS